MSQFKSDVYLSELFHYDMNQKKNSELQKGLREYRFLLLISSLSMQYLKTQDLEKFDSLVGENACQIRAIKIALIAHATDLGRLNDLICKIETVIESVDSLLSEPSIHLLMKQGCSLREVLDQNQLDVSLTEDEMFLIQSYLLCEMKECQVEGEFLPSILRMEKCSPSMIQKKYPEISYSFVEKLAKKLRVVLSVKSVDFVRQAAASLDNSSLIKMVSEDFELEHNKLRCIPTFWSFKTLFSLAQKQKIPLVFHIKFLNPLSGQYQVVDEDFLYFDLCSRQGTYHPIQPTEKELEKPACIIQGVVCPKEVGFLPSKEEWKIIFQQHPPIDMILAMGADHRQYPDPNRVVNVEDSEYEQYKRLAEGKGFALNNPTTFFVQHIYCSQAVRKMAQKDDFIQISYA